MTPRHVRRVHRRFILNPRKSGKRGFGTLRARSGEVANENFRLGHSHHDHSLSRQHPCGHEQRLQEGVPRLVRSDVQRTEPPNKALASCLVIAAAADFIGDWRLSRRRPCDRRDQLIIVDPSARRVVAIVPNFG